MNKLFAFMEGPIGRGLRVALGVFLVYVGIGRMGGLGGSILAAAGLLPIAMGLWGPCLLRLVLRGFERPRQGGAYRAEKDPVCGMDVAADAPLHVEHEGKTYVFCAEACLRRFKDSPDAYVAGAAGTPNRQGAST